jgi:hypothetical protein
MIMNYSTAKNDRMARDLPAGTKLSFGGASPNGSVLSQLHTRFWLASSIIRGVFR